MVRYEYEEEEIHSLDAEASDAKLEMLIKKDPKLTKTEIRDTLSGFVKHVLGNLEVKGGKFRLGSTGDFCLRDRLECWIAINYDTYHTGKAHKKAPEKEVRTVELNCTCNFIYDPNRQMTGYNLIFGITGPKKKITGIKSFQDAEEKLTSYLNSI